MYSVITLTSGTVIAHTLTILATPILTRLYTPEDMGTLASFLAITMIFGVIAAGRYEQAIVLPDNDHDTWVITMIGIAISFSLGLLITFSFILGGEWLSPIIGLSSVPIYWTHLIGFIVFLIGLQNILTKTAVRQRKFKTLASTQVMQKSCENGGKIGFGMIDFGVSGLLIGTIAGFTVRNANLLWSQRSFLYKESLPSLPEFYIQAKKYKKFPLVSSWSSLFNSASIHIPILLFASLFSPAIAGYFALSDRMLSLPAVFLGQNVASVFLERAARSRNNQKELSRITLKIYKKLLLISTITMSIITFYGDILFPIVFGEEWAEAGKYAQWMSVWVVFQLASSPLSTIYSLMGKQGEEFFWQISLFTTRVLPLVIFRSDAYLAVVVFSCFSVLMYSLLCVRVLRIAGVSYSCITKTTITICTPVVCIQLLIFLLI